MIQCKRVYDVPEKEDGYRVLVDKLWPRGVKKTDLLYDEWAKDLTPSSELRTAFHNETIDFAEFSRCYRAELAEHQQTAWILAERSKNGPVTLLYAAKNTQQNHALVLADFLRNMI
ncbi:DUF488 domain-containing protein [Klebsiella sp. BIGb0407]|uniref:DUF488 domain-containing protein n=1 Tax=Klebsiella sp. BIGb0407 TaxID=2940603 RepID=UPI002168C917|nr:DUF488 domain-containing protein [Klebsiella sp. BIGb0407]MCS3429499.1 uncharacterized protein YeaO (DUF488 family) [Klebsiella sp. BIGb0407]